MSQTSRVPEPRTPRQQTPTIQITSREDLAFVLSEASTLEHMVMCEYLFASFSLRKSDSDGMTSEQLEKTRRWESVVTTVAVQEMTHLALVNNLLVSIGHAPYFHHPNFPQSSRYFSPNVRLALMPFGEQALRHFLYLERPEGMSVEGVPGFEVLGDLNPTELRGGIVPREQYFTTVGNLYRGIEGGLSSLVQRYGEDGVFIGTGSTQATEERFGLPSLFEVKSLESATRAVDAIVEMGEGARGRWENSHFGMFLGVLKEYLESKSVEPDFTPTRPVVAAYARPPGSGVDVPLITEPFTLKVSEMFNSCYAIAVQFLSRFYVHDRAREGEIQTLADSAVALMSGVVRPLGSVLSTLPVGARLPGLTAGPTFELQDREYILPGREQAFMVLQERLVELAVHAEALSDEAPTSALRSSLKAIQGSLADLARGVSLDP